MRIKTTNTEVRAWLGAGALAGLLVLGVPLTAAEAQETRQDTSTARQDTSTQTAAADTARADSTQWGRSTDQDPEVQNPPGYRGMERPVNVFPADTADTSSAADASSRTSQLKRQDTISSENQNPPGYRGMERPVGTDSARAQQGVTEFIGTSSKPAVQARWRALLDAALNQPNPTRELQDAINKLRKQDSGTEAETTKKGTTKKTKSKVNSQEGRSATGATGEASRDSTDVIHRKRETPPGMGQEPPPYPSDSEQVWVRERPSGDSVTVGFDSTSNNQ